MRAISKNKNKSKWKRILGITLCLGLLASPLLIASKLIKSNHAVTAQAADYSANTANFQRSSDGAITAAFTVTNNDLNIKGWLLCLFDSKPSVDSSGKINGSNDIHPYSYSAAKHYFFVSSTAKIGTIQLTWYANYADQKSNWSASGSTSTTNNLKTCYESGSTWYIVIGPRHYNTSWGDSGIGAGTDGYWENCDFYVGKSTDVFPPSEQTMSVSVTNVDTTYNGAEQSIKVKVSNPSSGYTIKYRTASSGSYNLTTNPAYKNAGTYTVYFQVTSTGYTAYEGSGTVKIAKANPSYSPPSAKSGLVYNGSSQALINAGSSNVLYSLDGSSYSSNVPSQKDAGTYTVYYKVSESTNYKGVGPYTLSAKIEKANPTYTAPTAISGLVYNGSEQALLEAGSNVVYSSDGVSYSTIIPKATNAGNYTVYYKVEATANYKGVDPVGINVSIAKATPTYSAPEAKSGLVYNGSEQALVNAGSSNILYSLDGDTYSSGVPTSKDAGSYTVYYKVLETANYIGIGPETISVSIAKADPIYNAPTAKSNLVYNKESQALINEGSNVVYSLNGESYSSTVPSATNAGSYTVYYKVEETANYKGVEPTNFNVSIAKANPTYVNTPEAVVGLLYTGEEQSLISQGTSTGGTVKYSLDGTNYSTNIPKSTLVGTYNVYYKIEGDSNYNGVTAQLIEVSISPNDKTALNSAISAAQNYYESISNKYPNIAGTLDTAIYNAELVSENDNQTVAQIATAKDNLVHAYDLAHSEVVDVLIDDIGDVRYSDKCLDDIKEAEAGYDALTPDQQGLVNDHDDLLAARELYDKLDAVAKVIETIGEVTYDEDCLERISDAKEAYDSLSKDEQVLIPTLFNELTSAEDVYEMLGLIANLGDVTYSEEYKAALDEARNAYDALDLNEQSSVYNYQELVEAEEAYNNVDAVVKLVNEIDETLEYVGTHNPEIDKARQAYERLSDEEKALVPDLTMVALSEAEEEYEILKVEHERREIEDREAGVVIATEGGSGIPNTVSIDINNSQNGEQDFHDNIDYQTIQETISQEESISSICEIKFYEEVDGEIVELSLADIDENMSIVIKIDVPADVDDSDFKIVLLDDENNIIELEYTYDPQTRQATVVTNEVGTFAIIVPNKVPTVAKDGLPGTIIAAIAVSAVIIGVALTSLLKVAKKKNS